MAHTETLSSPILRLSSQSTVGGNHGPAADISWMMLDRFVFRREDDSFPDAKATHMRAHSFTSVGETFNVALLPAAPPTISRLYVQWPLSPPEPDVRAAELVTAHRSLLLLRITSPTGLNEEDYLQDYFVFKAAASVRVNSRLRRLPACTEPIVLPYEDQDITMKRWFHHHTIGLVSGCDGDEDEFAVVQLAKFIHTPGSNCKMGAELCVFRSRLSCSKSNTEDGSGVAEGKWEILELQIQHREEEFSDLKGWSTSGAITFNKSICWFDYHQGGILWYTPPPHHGIGEGSILYVRLPIDNRPNNSLPSDELLDKYRSLCVTGTRGNEQLKFVDVVRSVGIFGGRVTVSSHFTIACHTFCTEDNVWQKDATIASENLWHLNARQRSLMPDYAMTTFPLVSMDKPHLVHFLVSEPRKKIDKTRNKIDKLGNKIDNVWVVVIDITTDKIVSTSKYIEGEDLVKDADMVMHRARLPQSFLPSQF